jgi:hypothetical protein
MAATVDALEKKKDHDDRASLRGGTYLFRQHLSNS